MYIYCLKKWDHYNISLKMDQLEQLFLETGVTVSNINHLIKLDNHVQQLLTHTEKHYLAVNSSCTSLFTSELRKSTPDSTSTSMLHFKRNDVTII